MVNNFDVCHYDDMAIHFDVFAVTLHVTVARLTVVYIDTLICIARLWSLTVIHATQQDKY